MPVGSKETCRFELRGGRQARQPAGAGQSVLGRGARNQVLLSGGTLFRLALPLVQGSHWAKAFCVKRIAGRVSATFVTLRSGSRAQVLPGLPSGRQQTMFDFGHEAVC